MEEVLYISKKGMTVKDALINKAILWGQSPFTTTRISYGDIFLWKYHLKRLEKMIEYFCGKNPVKDTLEHINRVVTDIATDLKSQESVYLRVTLLETLDGSLDFFILATEKPKDDNSLKLKLSQIKSFGGHPNFIKNGEYSFSFKVRKELSEYEDFLYFDHQDNILELTTANVFLMKDDVFYTPELCPGVLDGTTRSAFLDFLHSENIAVKEVSINKNDLDKYSEAFCLNSFFGIRSIDSIDQIIYKKENTSRITRKFYNFCLENK